MKKTTETWASVDLNMLFVGFMKNKYYLMYSKMKEINFEL